MKWFNSIKKLAMPLPKINNDYPKDYNPINDFGLTFMNNNLNQKNVDKLNKEHQNLSYLGHGANGVAFLENNDPNIVIKVTSDVGEMESAKKLMNSNCPCIPKIFDVSQVQKDMGPYNTKNFFKIKLEKILFLITNPEEIKSINKISEEYQKLGYCPPSNSFLKEKDYNLIIKYLYKYSKFINCLAEHNIFPKYTRADNIGMRNNNEYVLLDLGQLNIVGADGFPI